MHTKEPFQRLLNPGMILGYSYRYYDDDLTDSATTPKRFPSSAVRLTDDGPIAAATGQPVRARWLVADGLEWTDDGTPVHPDDPDLPLEEVIEKMSKSRGNVTSPDEVIGEFGADSLRLYEMFMGPLEKGAPWSTDGIPGCFRFLQRVHRLLVDEDADGEPLAALTEGAGSPEQARLSAHTIRGVTDDLDVLALNTAISKLMVWARDVARSGPVPREGADAFVRLLAPFAPHLAEELWRKLGHDESLAYAAWPEADAALLVSETVRIAVQVNGKRRDEIEVPADADEETILAAARASERVQKHMSGREPRKVIVVPGRLVNFVV